MKAITHFMSNTFNIGDAVISDGVDKVLKNFLKDDFEICKINQQSNLLWQNFYGIDKKTINFFNKPDFVLIGGHPSIGLKKLLDIKTDLIDIPTFMIGVGARHKLKDNVDPDYERYISRYLKQCRAISTRDQESYDFVKKYNSNVYLTGCPALYLHEREFKYKDTDYVVICFDGRCHFGRDFYEQLIKKLKARNLEVICIVHDFRELDKVKDIAQKSGCYYLASPSYQFYEPYLSHARFVVSFRLHGTILSSTLGCPFINVIGDVRGEDFKKLFDPQGDVHVSAPETMPSKWQMLEYRLRKRLGWSKKESKGMTAAQKYVLAQLEPKIDAISNGRLDFNPYYSRVNAMKKNMVQFVECINKHI